MAGGSQRGTDWKVASVGAMINRAAHLCLPLLLTGCGLASIETKDATLVNPATGSSMTCHASSRPDPLSTAVADSRFDSCLKQARAQGYQ